MPKEVTCNAKCLVIVSFFFYVSGPARNCKSTGFFFFLKLKLPPKILRNTTGYYWQMAACWEHSGNKPKAWHESFYNQVRILLIQTWMRWQNPSLPAIEDRKSLPCFRFFFFFCTSPALMQTMSPPAWPSSFSMRSAKVGTSKKRLRSLQPRHLHSLTSSSDLKGSLSSWHSTRAASMKPRQIYFPDFILVGKNCMDISSARIQRFGDSEHRAKKKKDLSPNR